MISRLCHSRSWLTALCPLLAAALAACSEADQAPTLATVAAASPIHAAACPVTTPNGWTPNGGPGAATMHYGNEALQTLLYPDGSVVFAPGGPGRINADGSLEMKWLWWRVTPGVDLTITGRRLDAEAPPLTASIPGGYRSNLQSTSLHFSTPGCWEITASTVDGSLTFITRALIADEPAASAPFDCPVTIPNASTPPGQRPYPTQHGNGRLWLPLPIDGRPTLRPPNVLPMGYGTLGADGSVGIRIPVWRANPEAEITIEGRRLDADAPPLDAELPPGTEGTTLQMALLDFPTLGCWEITIHGGDDALTVVMLLGD